MATETLALASIIVRWYPGGEIIRNLNDTLR
jgi:hypothetical protein